MQPWTLSRRSFIQTAAGAAGLGLASPGVGAQRDSTFPQRTSNGRTACPASLQSPTDTSAPRTSAGRGSAFAMRWCAARSGRDYGFRDHQTLHHPDRGCLGRRILRISSRRIRSFAADAMETMPVARNRARDLREIRRFARDPLKACVMSFDMESPPQRCPPSIFRPTRSMHWPP
jgi:hypothetical protein